MKINWFRGYTGGDVFLPPVFLKSYKDFDTIVLSLSWESSKFNLELFFDEVVDKIHLEFLEERTKVSKNSVSGYSEDLESLYHVINSLIFSETHRERKLVELIFFKKMNHKILVYSLGHFNIFALKGEISNSVLNINDFSVNKYLLPQRGLGISDKSSVITMELSAGEEDEYLIVRGLFVPQKNNFSELEINKNFLETNNISSNWIFHLVF